MFVQSLLYRSVVVQDSGGDGLPIFLKKKRGNSGEQSLELAGNDLFVLFPGRLFPSLLAFSCFFYFSLIFRMQDIDEHIPLELHGG